VESVATARQRVGMGSSALKREASGSVSRHCVRVQWHHKVLFVRSVVAYNYKPVCVVELKPTAQLFR